MELILMLLLPFPIGLLVKSRLAAFVTYIAVHGFVFTVQSLVLLTEWVGGSKAAFGPYPNASHSQVWGYAAVNTAIFAVGLGLVAFGQRVGAKRAQRQPNKLSLDSARA